MSVSIEPVVILKPFIKIKVLDVFYLIFPVAQFTVVWNSSSIYILYRAYLRNDRTTLVGHYLFYLLLIIFYFWRGKIPVRVTAPRFELASRRFRGYQLNHLGDRRSYILPYNGGFLPEIIEIILSTLRPYVITLAMSFCPYSHLLIDRLIAQEV